MLLDRWSSKTELGLQTNLKKPSARTVFFLCPVEFKHLMGPRNSKEKIEIIIIIS